MSDKILVSPVFDGEGRANNERNAERVAKSLRQQGFTCEVLPLPGQTNTFQGVGVFMHPSEAKRLEEHSTVKETSRIEKRMRKQCTTDLEPYIDRMIDLMKSSVSEAIKNGEQHGWPDDISYPDMRSIARKWGWGAK